MGGGDIGERGAELKHEREVGGECDGGEAAEVGSDAREGSGHGGEGMSGTHGVGRCEVEAAKAVVREARLMKGVALLLGGRGGCVDEVRGGVADAVVMVEVN